MSVEKPHSNRGPDFGKRGFPEFEFRVMRTAISREKAALDSPESRLQNVIRSFKLLHFFREKPQI
eukprot:8471334-Pyramimonas_sp.AAC.1